MMTTYQMKKRLRHLINRRRRMEETSEIELRMYLIVLEVRLNRKTVNFAH